MAPGDPERTGDDPNPARKGVQLNSRARWCAKIRARVFSGLIGALFWWVGRFSRVRPSVLLTDGLIEPEAVKTRLLEVAKAPVGSTSDVARLQKCVLSLWPPKRVFVDIFRWACHGPVVAIDTGCFQKSRLENDLKTSSNSPRRGFGGLSLEDQAFKGPFHLSLRQNSAFCVSKIEVVSADNLKK